MLGFGARFVEGDGGPWFGVVANSGEQGLWFTVEAAPSLPAAFGVEGVAGFVGGGGEVVVGYRSLPGPVLVVADSVEGFEVGVWPLSTVFPVGAGFRVSWGDDRSVLVTDLPALWDLSEHGDHAEPVVEGNR